MSWGSGALDGAAYLFNTATTYAVGTPSRIGDALGLKPNVEISRMYPTLITPAGWAFAIWGPIYLMEGYSTLFGSGVATTDNTDVSVWWRRACVLQGAWAVCFGCGERPVFIGLSTALIMGIAKCTREVYFGTQPATELGTVSRLGFAMHSAWVGAASLVGVSLAARAYKLGPSIEFPLAVASELVAAGVGVTTAVDQSDPVYAFVTAWALWAIGSNPANIDTNLHPGNSEDALRWLSILGKGLSCTCLLLGTYLTAKPMLK